MSGLTEASLETRYFEAAEAGDERAMARLNREPGMHIGPHNVARAERGEELGPAGVFEQNVAFTVAAMRKEEENRVVRWAVVRGFHERTAAPSSEPRRQSRVQVVSLRAASMYL